MDVDLLIHFCKKMKKAGLRIRSNATMLNMYERQVVKIHKSLTLLHEDLQVVYADELKGLELK